MRYVSFIKNLDNLNGYLYSDRQSSNFLNKEIQSNLNRPLHDGGGMMSNQGKNFSEWVSKMRFFDDFSQIFQFQNLDFSWSKNKYVF